MKYEIKLFDELNEKERGAIPNKTKLKDIFGFSRTVCQLPGNINKEEFMKILRIYAFNEEYIDSWTHLLIKKVE
jgi:thioredoxin-related protein